MNQLVNNIPRVMIVGTGSGCGKTTVTCALLKALVDKQLNTISFKCGPDYIDPMFHSQIIGTKSRNLDAYLCGEETVKYLLAEDSKGCDVAVIEGVMGMYDGLGFDDDKYSANYISQITDTYQILVVDVKGKSLSLIAEINGYSEFKRNKLKGIILNNCSDGMYLTYKNMVEKRTSLKVFGYLPKVKEAEIGSRHLGLVTVDEIDDIKEKTQALGDVAKKTLDIEGILALAKDSQKFSYDDIVIEKEIEGTVNIGVARDKAFCFYYEDNFELLKKLGANLVFFSPLADSEVPKGIDGLILGGGYPEENIKGLAGNKSMLESLKVTINSGIPTFAECGGFMYLGKHIADEEGEHPVVGVIPETFHMTKGLVRFGYKELCANRDNILCKKGEKIKCHEFHYSDADNYGDCFTATKESGKTWQCMVSEGNILAGYPHLHFWSNIDFARNFVRRCKGDN
ncbi:MAG: cobyrinate a,c-diamide synthase [Anaerovoracaceae bacterium]